MPIGDSVPCGVSTVHRVADADAELRREVAAEQDAVGLVGAAPVERRRGCPLRIARADVGDARLERGIDALELMNASPRAAVTSALPRIAGAAPMTCGTCRSFAASAW